MKSQTVFLARSFQSNSFERPGSLKFCKQIIGSRTGLKNRKLEEYNANDNGDIEDDDDDDNDDDNDKGIAILDIYEQALGTNSMKKIERKMDNDAYTEEK
jgi:hypothetical protein